MRELSGADTPSVAADYVILGRRIRIAGNHAPALKAFNDFYEPMRVPPAGVKPDLQIAFAYRIGPDGARMDVSCGDRSWTLENMWAEWPCASFTLEVLSTCLTHFPVHAGCVARGGRAIVVAGASGMGKSTLVSQLATRGWMLLSDEIAPITRSPGHVDPYPLRVGLRPGPSQALASQDDAPSVRTANEYKRLVSVEMLTAGVVPVRAKLDSAIFLSQRTDATVVTSRKLQAPVRALFEAWNPGLEADLAVLCGHCRLNPAPEVGGVSVLLPVSDATGLMDRLKELAVRHGTGLIEAMCEDYETPDYGAEPVLAPIPASAGVLELLKHVPPMVRRRIAESTCGGSTARLVAELAASVADVRFFRLRPGRLEDELRLVGSLVP